MAANGQFLPFQQNPLSGHPDRSSRSPDEVNKLAKMEEVVRIKSLWSVPHSPLGGGEACSPKSPLSDMVLSGAAVSEAVACLGKEEENRLTLCNPA
ncbi:hypothetical protein DPEC_G00209420 [Dallia pectoralis]|uniref:Uncharacterized protein n=1 Tax=Dallia pectoralis TaxID=75939 RepID=A0ACC2G5P2_DALPE|nr:hypothetical protein DPEC_G00209420 [Dallia pectoralis]